MTNPKYQIDSNIQYSRFKKFEIFGLVFGAYLGFDICNLVLAV